MVGVLSTEALAVLREAMSRREFIILLGGALVSLPLVGGAQQPGPTRRVGLLTNLSENDPATQRSVRVFREEMGALGWADGRNLKVDYRWSGGDVGRVRAFAKELVGLSPDIIVAYFTPSVLALQQETRSIPIVFLSVTDPLGQGIVGSLARPAVILQDSRISSSRSAVSGWRLSNRFHPASDGLSPSSIQKRHPTTRYT